MLQIGIDRFETINQPVVKHAAFSVQDHLHGLFMSIRRFVYPLANQRIIDIREGNNLCGDRNLIPFQVVRVSITVPAFVVPAADLPCILYQFLIAAKTQFIQHLLSACGVGFHDFELFSSEFAGFIQDLFRNLDFTDIMQSGRIRDQCNMGFIHRILRITFPQRFQ